MTNARRPYQAQTAREMEDVMSDYDFESRQNEEREYREAKAQTPFDDFATVRAALDLLEEFNLPYIVDKLAKALAALDRLEARGGGYQSVTELAARHSNLREYLTQLERERDLLAQQLATARATIEPLSEVTPAGPQRGSV